MPAMAPFSSVQPEVLTRLPATRHSEVPRLLPDAWLKAHADETGTSSARLTYAPRSR